MKNVGKAISYLVLYLLISSMLAVALVLTYELCSGTSSEDEYFDLLCKASVIAESMTAVLFGLHVFISDRSENELAGIHRLKGHWALTFIGIALVLNFITDICVNIASNYVDSSDVSALEESLSAALTFNPFVSLICTGILIPILEECVFRYGICRNLSKINTALGIIASSVLFGIMHGNVIQDVYACALGLVFATIYVISNNICYTMLMHIAINSSSIICNGVYEYFGIIPELIVYYGIFFIGFLIVAVEIIRYIRNRNRSKQ
jgi:hypothetical protein